MNPMDFKAWGSSDVFRRRVPFGREFLLVPVRIGESDGADLV